MIDKSLQDEAIEEETIIKQEDSDFDFELQLA